MVSTTIRRMARVSSGVLSQWTVVSQSSQLQSDVTSSERITHILLASGQWTVIVVVVVLGEFGFCFFGVYCDTHKKKIKRPLTQN